jgi:protein SCO1/2
MHLSLRALCRYVVSGLLILLAAGCRQDRGEGSGAPPAAGGSPLQSEKNVRPSGVETVTDYPLKGVVRKVARDTGDLTIRHEAISGLMGAMTMPFPLKDRAVLDRVQSGDSVEGTLRVWTDMGVVNHYELLGLTVVKQASPHVDRAISKGMVPVQQGRPRKLETGETVPDFAMTTQDGSVVKLSELRGNVVVLTFIYTRCPLPDFCPLMDRKFADLSQKISTFPARSKKIRLISLSFDPEHDTPDVLRKHAQVRGAVPPLWTYAVASHDELAKIAAPLGLFYEPGTNEIAHNLSTAVIDPEGKLARLEVGTQRNRWETTDLLKTIYSLLPASNH